MRTRTSGGVRGGAGRPPLLLDLEPASRSGIGGRDVRPGPATEEMHDSAAQILGTGNCGILLPEADRLGVDAQAGGEGGASEGKSGQAGAALEEAGPASRAFGGAVGGVVHAAAVCLPAALPPSFGVAGAEISPVAVPNVALGIGEVGDAGAGVELVDGGVQEGILRVLARASGDSAGLCQVPCWISAWIWAARTSARSEPYWLRSSWVVKSKGLVESPWRIRSRSLARMIGAPTSTLRVWRQWREQKRS